ncbi:MAG: insulinase family protein [Gelidibacter sp.]|nr:insulinase family protein [Gelidibacter sp.]
MKTKIAAFIVLFLMAFGTNAQIDRSKQPQPGPAPKIALDTPQEFTLKNGLKVLVVENHKLPRVSYSLNIDNKPIVEGKKAGESDLLGAMLGNGTTSISKDDFNEEVDFLGANISFGASSAYASSLTQYSSRILELMADAAINPLLTEEEFQKEKDKLLEGLKSSEKSVDAIAGRVGNALSYGKNHPYGEITSEETVNNVSFGDVVAFYDKYFNPNNAYLVVIGDVNFKAVKKEIENRFGKWEKSVDVNTTVPEATPNVQYTQINFVDMPNAVQSNINLTNNIDLKMSDPDYHAVLIANKILGGGFNSYLNMNLREAHAYTYGARSSVSADKYVGEFSATTAVRNMVTDSAVVQTLKEIKRIKTEPVDAEALKNAKAKYVGDFVLALERPQTIARYALNIKINNLPSDFYQTYLQKINAVTAEDVMRVANKYFKTENARVIVVGKGSDVLENLEKTGIPIKYFDTYANPVEKPVFSKPIPAGVTAQTVIDAYLTAVGGKDKAKTVNSVYQTADVTIEGAPFKPKAEMKSMAPNKESLEMSIEGMGVIMKQKFNGTTGYAEQQGMKKELSAEEVAEKQADHAIFPELYYDASAVSLESATTIDGKDVYKLKVTEGKQDTFRYYDATTGFLIRTEATQEAQGQSITTVIDYGNYSPVNGVQFPYSQSIKTGPQVINLNITNVKVNEGVTDADFN